MDAALLLSNLKRSYGAVNAVDGVSLTVEPGEFVTLLGPSGSGKTSTLKMIAGFERPESGSIHLGAVDITNREPHLRNIGMVFQNYALFPHMNVFDNIAFPLRMRKWSASDRRNAVSAALEMVHLEGLEARMPRELSGGQQQRVALARALVFRPPLLLMDEPLGALDHQLRRQVQAEIKRLHQSLKLTVIFVTHDQEEAMFLSDRIAVMQRGRIVQLGTPAQLYARPINRFVASFVGDSNLLPGRVAALNGSSAEIEIGAGTRYCGRAGDGIRAGDAVACLVRPENIALHVGDAAAEGTAGVLGKVMLASFLGDSLEFEISTSLGSFRVRRRIDLQWPAPAPGESVRLTWDPLDLLAVRDER
jgi:ABC-type Fe3+/spermidine/putrescine transport system ATPase subunit